MFVLLCARERPTLFGRTKTRVDWFACGALDTFSGALSLTRVARPPSAPPALFCLAFGCLRAKKRMQYNRRFVNVVTGVGGKRLGPNSNAAKV